MGKYQDLRGDSEQKLFYIIDDLYGGMNTDYSDDSVDDNEFNSMVNFDLSTTGSLNKRLGWGKSNAVSKILNLFTSLPVTYLATPNNPYPDSVNDNLLYMKLIKNDNDVFNKLSAYDDYRDYQRQFGYRGDSFHMLLITKNVATNICSAWLLSVTLPYLSYDEGGNELPADTIVTTKKSYELPISFMYDKQLTNIQTIEYYDKIYMTSNNSGLIVFNRTTEEFTYYRQNVAGVTNEAYKPNAMEIRKVGFNVLGDDPLHWVNYQNISTDSIQGIYLTTTDGIPVLGIPTGGKFKLNILYTGSVSDFNITFTEGTTTLSYNSSVDTEKTSAGIKVLNIDLTTVPTSETEIKIEKVGVSIDPYYDYYDVKSVDSEAKVVTALNVGDHGIVEMYNRAVYYKDDTIWFSDVNIFDYVPNYNYVTLPIEPTDRIVKICYFKSVYIIFTERTIYKMTGAFGDNDFAVEPVNLSLGCSAPNTVVPVENELYFVSKTGLYALVSSAYREGIENLKELDNKIKTITTTHSTNDDVLTKQVRTYDGVSKRAVAFRYKDKYLLFNNTWADDNSVFSAKNYDVLCYDFNIKAFSIIQFMYKPTFVYNENNRLITYCMYAAKEEFTVEETLLNYDYNNIVNGVVPDLSDNNLDGTITGNYETAYTDGAIFDGVDDKVDLPVLNNVPFNKDFYITEDVILNSGENESLFYLGQSDIYLDPSVSQISGGMGIITDFGANVHMEYTLTADVDAKRNLGINRGNMNVNIYITDIPANVLTPKISTGMSLLVGGDVLNIADVSISNFTGSNYIVSGTYTVPLNDDLSLSDTLYWGVNINYKKQTGTTGNGGTSGSGAGGDVNSNEGYAGLSTRIYYEYSQNGSTMQTTINSYLQLRRNQSYDSSNNGGAGKALYIGGVLVYSGSGIDVRGYAVGTWYTVGSGSRTLSHNSSGVLGGVNLSGSIATGLSQGTMSPSLNIYPPDFNLTPVYTDYVYNHTVNEPVSMIGIAGTSKQDFCLTADTVNNKWKFFANNETGSDTCEIDSNYTLIGSHKFAFYYNSVTNKISVTVDGQLDAECSLTKTGLFSQSYKDNCSLFYNPISGHYTSGEIKLFNIFVKNDDGEYDAKLYYGFEEGNGTVIKDISEEASLNGTFNGTWLSVNCLRLKSDAYLSVPEIPALTKFTNGFKIELDVMLPYLTTNDLTLMELSNNGSCPIKINTVGDNDTIKLSTTSINFNNYNISHNPAGLTNRHKFVFQCLDNGTGYTVSIIKDNVTVETANYNYGGITDIVRKTNFIGKALGETTTTEMYLFGTKIVILKSVNPEPVYEPCIFEYDRAYTDFFQPIYIELKSKGINMKYPMHIKKLKNIFIKGLGGFSYNEFYFELYKDGHIVNDPKKYTVSIDEATGQVLYNYEAENYLSFDEAVSTLGNFRLGYTPLGKTTYQTKKLVLPAKGKNFYINISGFSSDKLTIESVGFVFKLGKVKQG